LKAGAVDAQYSVERSKVRFRTLRTPAPTAVKLADLRHFARMEQTSVRRKTV
jgi:hypothetical protein